MLLTFTIFIILTNNKLFVANAHYYRNISSQEIINLRNSLVHKQTGKLYNKI